MSRVISIQSHVVHGCKFRFVDFENGNSTPSKNSSLVLLKSCISVFVFFVIKMSETRPPSSRYNYWVLM